MTRFAARLTTFAALLVIAPFALAACGDSKDDSADTPVNTTSEAGRLTHIDGSLKLDGKQVRLTPANGDQPIEFDLGPEVQPSTVQALLAANGRARVFYDSSAKDSPALAVAVEPAPSAGEGAKTYDGTVKKVSDTSITIDGDDGDKTFAIEAKDLPAFDVPHLNEHKDEQSPVRIYYRGSGDDAHAVAYEDA